MQKPNEEKIEQWCEFISNHLYNYDLFAYLDIPEKKPRQLYCQCTIAGKRKCISNMLLNLDEYLFNASYYVDIKKIQNLNNYLNEQFTDEGKNISDLPKKIRVQALKYLDLNNGNKYFKKMTNRQYLQWRLEVIKDGHGQHMPEESISLKATIGLAFLSLIGMYWFFAPKTKPSIKILMGILTLFAVATLISFIVCNLSLYSLISAAIVYGLFVLAGCIHVGLRRYKENVKYQEEFGNTYNELMEYLNQTEPPKSLDNKINELNQGQKNLSEIKEEKKEENMSPDI